jgi:hypothetical protein
MLEQVSDELREKALPFLKRGLEMYTDEQLVAKHEWLLGIAREAIALIKKETGLTVAEFALMRCAENPALFATLPTPWGGVVKDHCLPDYRGFEATAWAAVEPLDWNRIPVNVPYATKLAIAREQLIKASTMLAAGFAAAGYEIEGDATTGIAPPPEEELVILQSTTNHPHGDETWDPNVQNHVRWVVAGAQYWALLEWPERMKQFEQAPRNMARAQRIDAIIGLLKFVMPGVFKRAVEIGEEGAVL